MRGLENYCSDHFLTKCPVGNRKDTDVGNRGMTKKDALHFGRLFRRHD